MQQYPEQDCTYYAKGRGKRQKTLEIKKHGNILVPTNVGKMIVDLVVTFFEVNLSYWQDWDYSKSGLANKSPRDSFLCSATMSPMQGMNGWIILGQRHLIQKLNLGWKDFQGWLRKICLFAVIQENDWQLHGEKGNANFCRPVVRGSIILVQKSNISII